MFGNAGFSTGPAVGDREGSPQRVRAMKLQMMNESIRSTVETFVAKAPPKPKQKGAPEGPQMPSKKEKKKKKGEKPEKEGKGKKEKKEKKEKKKKKGSSDSSGNSSGWFYKGKQCTVTAISYETDPPHAVVRTHDNREVVVDMNALVHRSKRKRKAAAERASKKPSQPITIECCSSGSASGSSDSGIEVVGETPGPEALAKAALAKAASAAAAPPKDAESGKGGGGEEGGQGSSKAVEPLPKDAGKEQNKELEA